MTGLTHLETQKMSKSFIKNVLIVFSFLCLALYGHAQDNPFELGPKIRINLENTEVTPDEIRVELLVRGISLDSLQNRSLPEVVSLIEEIIAVLEMRNNKPVKKDTIVQIIQSEPQLIAVPQYTQPAPPRVVEKKVPPPPEKDPLPKPEPKPKGIGIWGQHIFRDSTITVYQTSVDAKPPDTYILGVGDEVTISIFGRSQADLRFEINEEGYISPEGMGRIFLKGINYGEAKRLLLQRFRQAYIFQPEQFTANVTGVRNININIFGEVFKTGSYNIPAINSAFNAVMAAGGPTDIGSVRNIELIRNGQKKILDVYDYMLDPSIEFFYQLLHNDVIYVPAIGRVVTAKGAVNRVFRYELIEGENLVNLIEYAGGLRGDAYTENIQIERFVDTERILLDVNWKELQASGQDFELMNGDVITVKTIEEAVDRKVTITGEVEDPGDYALDRDMRVSNLISKGKLKESARRDVAYLMRVNPDQTTDITRLRLDNILAIPESPSDIFLKPKDRLVIFSQSKFVDKAQVSIKGAVREPQSIDFDTDGGIKIQDLVILAGGLKPNAARMAFLKRVDPTNPELVDYVRIDLQDAMRGQNAYFNFPLKANDQLIVYTKDRYTELYKFKIEGAIREANTFDFDDGLLLSDAIYMAGGLEDKASDVGYVVRTDLENPDLKTYLRVDVGKIVEMPGSAHDVVIQPLDHIFILDNPSFTDTYSIKILGAVRNPGEYQLGENLEIKDVLMLAGGLKFEADTSHIDVYRLGFEGNESTRHFVTTLRVDKAYNLLQSDDLNFELQAYDHIVVRQIPGFESQRLVKIEGEVRYPGFYGITKDNQKVSDIIKEAGGFLPEAYPLGATLYRVKGNKGFVVLDLNKAVKNDNSRDNIVLRDGDLITIPKKEDLVYIRVQGTKAGDLYPDKFKDNGMISLAYQGKRNAKWYIDNFAAGYSKTAKRNTTTIERMNQGIRGTKDRFLYKEYPIVEKGSTIGVGLKPPRKVREARQGGSKINWDNTLGKTLSAVTSVLGLVLLINQLQQ